MQMKFLDFIRSRPVLVLPKHAIIHRQVEAEYPIVRKGQIISFVDVIEILTVNFTTIVSLFELKPEIYTVPGTVRQAKAILQIAQREIPGDVHTCHLVVPSKDPALQRLRDEWPHVWAWGISFEPLFELDELPESA